MTATVKEFAESDLMNHAKALRIAICRATAHCGAASDAELRGSLSSPETNPALAFIAIVDELQAANKSIMACLDLMKTRFEALKDHEKRNRSTN